jgi:hypothetical protein
MRKLACWALFFAANLSAASYGAGLDAVDGAAEATLSWRLQFGAGDLQPGYAFAVGYRGEELAGKLLEIDVSDAHALARLAGLPVLDRRYRMDQNHLGTVPVEAAATRPWYARQWVWWTAGGAALTLALTGGDGTLEYNHNSNTTTSRGNDGCAGVSGNVGDQEIPCGSETVGTQCAEGPNGQTVCVFCGNNGVTDGCSEWTGGRVVAGVTVDVERQRWLDAGTGRMGDLPAVH